MSSSMENINPVLNYWFVFVIKKIGQWPAGNYPVGIPHRTRSDTLPGSRASYLNIRLRETVILFYPFVPNEQLPIKIPGNANIRIVF